MYSLFLIKYFFFKTFLFSYFSFKIIKLLSNGLGTLLISYIYKIKTLT